MNTNMPENRDELIEEITAVIASWDMKDLYSYAYEQMELNMKQEDTENLERYWLEIYSDE